MPVWAVSTFWLLWIIPLWTKMYKNLFQSWLSTEGPSFVLQISQHHLEILSSKVSIISNVSWSATWIWELLQSAVWFQIHALILFACPVCTELHFPDSLALRLPGSFSQREALEAERSRKGERPVYSFLYPFAPCGLLDSGCIFPWLQLHQERPLGFKVLPGNPDLCLLLCSSSSREARSFLLLLYSELLHFCTSNSQLSIACAANPTH